MLAQVQKWGNSFGVRIPRPLVRMLGINLGASVELGISRGRLVVTPVARKRYRLSRLIAGISDANRHREVRTGPRRGREVW